MIFDALQAAQARGIEVLIADTAGRLHTQQGLMDELGKIRRVLQKLDADRAARSADGDRRHHRPERVCRSCGSSTQRSASPAWSSPSSTAPPRAAWCSRSRASSACRSATSGIGERPEDLRVFDAEAFVDALLPDVARQLTASAIPMQDAARARRPRRLGWLVVLLVALVLLAIAVAIRCVRRAPRGCAWRRQATCWACRSRPRAANTACAAAR